METRPSKLEKIKYFIKLRWKWILAGAATIVALLVSLFQRRDTNRMLKNQKETSEKIISAEKQAREQLESNTQAIEEKKQDDLKKVGQKYKKEEKRLESEIEKEKTDISSVAKSISDLTGAEHVIIEEDKK